MHLTIKHFGFLHLEEVVLGKILHQKSRVSILRVELPFSKLIPPPLSKYHFLPPIQTSLYSAFCPRVSMLIFIQLWFSMFLILLFARFCYILLFHKYTAPPRAL